jgi:hypothetical protein
MSNVRHACVIITVATVTLLSGFRPYGIIIIGICVCCTVAMTVLLRDSCTTGRRLVPSSSSTLRN